MNKMPSKLRRLEHSQFDKRECEMKPCMGLQTFRQSLYLGPKTISSNQHENPAFAEVEVDRVDQVCFYRRARRLENVIQSFWLGVVSKLAFQGGFLEGGKVHFENA